MKKINRSVFMTQLGLFSVLFISTAATSFASGFSEYQRQLQAEFAAYQEEEQKAFTAYKNKIANAWGKHQLELSNKHQEVAYQANFQQRVIIDHQRQTLRIESLTEQALNAEQKRQLLQNAFTAARQLPLQQARNTEKPMPQGRVDAAPGLIEGMLPSSATEKKNQVLKLNVQASLPIRSQKIHDSNTPKIIHSLEIPLQDDYLRKRVNHYLPQVKKEAARFGLAPSLILAIIETESHFNPYAESPASAYGLMQLVPTSGARDAYRYLFREDKVVGKDYLFNPEKNIELGVAYLKLLKNRYFKSVKDLESRQWCMIAAYNTGSLNVYRSFTKQGKIAALPMINRLTAAEIYAYLRKNLPAQETRDYLKKVSKRQAKYKNYVN